jgi:hypothetical protein
MGAHEHAPAVAAAGMSVASAPDDDVPPVAKATVYPPAAQSATQPVGGAVPPSGTMIAFASDASGVHAPVPPKYWPLGHVTHTEEVVAVVVDE